MSEEEIIKEIEIIKATQDIMQHNLDIYPPKEDIYKLDTKQLKAVICLLDLYNKEKEKNKEYENKIKAVLELIDTKPYTAYTLYGDILYDDENIRELLEERN
jgi:hypothetical protein